MRKPLKREQDPEQLQIDNEIRKLKLQLEYGAGFHNPDPHCKIPPAVEKIFLDQVEEFHKVHSESKKILLYDFIGCPEFKNGDLLSDTQLSIELKRLKKLLLENFIMCDCVYETDDRAVYTFITEELFFQEIENIRIPGMVLHIIYEEYHPNHESDIEQKCCDFIKIFLSKQFDEFIFEDDHDLANMKHLRDFRNAFAGFELHEIKEESVTINNDKAEAVFKLEFSAFVGGSGREKISGFARIYLNCKYEWWTINRALFPGMHKH